MRARPVGFENVRVFVIGPSDGFDRFIDRSARRPHGWGLVYEDLGDLELTARLIRERPVVRFPDENRLLIESVYHESRREILAASDAWERYTGEIEGHYLAQESIGRSASIPFSEYYGDPHCAERFSAAAERGVRTRLGDETIHMRLPTNVPCHFAAGAYTAEVDLPLRALLRAGVPLDGLDHPESVRKVEDSRTSKFLVGEKLILRYTRYGWERDWTD